MESPGAGDGGIPRMLDGCEREKHYAHAKKDVSIGVRPKVTGMLQRLVQNGGKYESKNDGGE